MLIIYNASTLLTPTQALYSLSSTPYSCLYFCVCTCTTHTQTHTHQYTHVHSSEKGSSEPIQTKVKVGDEMVDAADFWEEEEDYD